MIHDPNGAQDRGHRTQSLAQSELNRLQMSWETDVEDVYPIVGGAWFYFLKEFPNLLKRVSTTSVTEPERLVAALKASLESWSILRSIAVEYDEATRLLIVLRATPRYFDQAISIHADVDDEQALKEISMPISHVESELPQGLLFRVVVARVKSTGTVGMVIVRTHAIYDDVSLKVWERDLEALISGGSLTRMVPHKAFVETYYLHQTSLAARMATEYHVQRLRGIGSLHHALWPPPKSFDGLPVRAGVPNEKGMVDVTEGGGQNDAKIVRSRRSPSFVATKSRTSTLTIAAVAIFNACVTGSEHAMFSTILRGREWPFLADSLAQLLPDPTSIAGPTLVSTLLLLKVNKGERVSHFLARLEAELRLLSRHQHVPHNFPAQLDEADRAVWRDARRQVFNYVPNGTMVERAPPDSQWRSISDRHYYVDRSNRFFHWMPGFSKDAQTLSIEAHFNPDMFTARQVEGFAESVLDVVAFLGDMKNWEREVREAQAVLSTRESRL